MSDLLETDDRPGAGARMALIAKNIGLFCLTAGIVFFGSRMLRGTIWSVQSDTVVLVAQRNLTAGDVVIASDVTWERAKVPVGIDPVRGEHKEGVIGSMLLTDVSKDSVVPQTSLVPIGSGHSLAAAVAAGRSAITIPGEKLGSGTGTLAPGDRVDVLLTADARALRQASGTRGANGAGNVTVLLVHEARVLQIATPGRRDVRRADLRAVTLDLSPDDAQKVALGMATGKISIIAINGTSLPDGMRITTLPEIMPVAESAETTVKAAKPRVTVVSGTKTQVIEVQR